jgi:hypothetical protein
VSIEVSGARRSGPAFVRALLLAVALTVLLGAGIGSAWSARLPTADVPTSEQARLHHVTDTATVATRVEATPFTARRDLFEYLLDHPEFASHVTRALKLARYRIWREADGLWLDDGWGTRGRFEVVHAANGVRVMYARGSYEPRFLPSISGEAVVVIEYVARPAAPGRTEIAPAISGFVKLDNPVLAAAGRFASAVARAKADKEAKGLARLFARTTRAVEEDPGRVCALLVDRPDVPRHDLEEFRRLLSLPPASTP